jgi:ABC-type multidrug transport system permease subunit
MLQQVRDPLTLILTLFTTPFFIFFYWLIIGNANPIQFGIYLPQEATSRLPKEFKTKLEEKILALEKESRKEFKMIRFTSKEEFLKQILFKNLSLSLTIISPEENAHPVNTQITIGEHESTSKIHFLAIQTKSSFDDLILASITSSISVRIDKKKSALDFSNFAAFVPGFLVFSIIMIVFSTAMMLTSEVEAGLLLRYTLSKTPVIQYLLGTGCIQLVNALFSILLSISVTKFLGHDFNGHGLIVFMLCGLGAISSIGIGMLLASFLSTTSQAFLTSSFLMFLLLLFSGIIFPKPDIAIFNYLPTTLLKNALDSLLFEEKSMSELSSSVFSLLGSSIFSIIIGSILFRKIFLYGGKNK